MEKLRYVEPLAMSVALQERCEAEINGDEFKEVREGNEISIYVNGELKLIIEVV